MAEKYQDYFIKFPCVISSPDIGPPPGDQAASSEGSSTLNYNFVSSDTNPANDRNIKGVLFFGVRLQETLYLDNDFRDFCGFITREKIQRDFRGVTAKMIRNYNDAARIALVKSYYMELVANDAGSTFPAYGEKHRTYMVVDNSIPEDAIMDRLYNQDILVGPDRIKYTVTPSSIEVRSSRRMKKQF